MLHFSTFTQIKTHIQLKKTATVHSTSELPELLLWLTSSNTWVLNLEAWIIKVCAAGSEHADSDANGICFWVGHEILLENRYPAVWHAILYLYTGNINLIGLITDLKQTNKQQQNLTYRGINLDKSVKHVFSYCNILLFVVKYL